MVRELDRTAQLVVQAQSGDEEALNTLLQRYSGRIRALARARLNGGLRRYCDSEDVMQQVLISAMRGLEDFEIRSEAAFLHWISTTCSNQIRDLARRAKRQCRDQRREVALDGAQDDEGAAPIDVPDSGPSPGTQVVREERQDLVLSALEQLDDAQRELVHMRDYCGMSWAEIGGKLGIAEDAARKRHTTAKIKLARTLRTLGYSATMSIVRRAE